MKEPQSVVNHLTNERLRRFLEYEGNDSTEFAADEGRAMAQEILRLRRSVVALWEELGKQQRGRLEDNRKRLQP